MSLEVILIILVIILVGIIFFMYAKITNNKFKMDDNSVKLLLNQINELNKNVDFRLAESNRNSLRQSELNSSISKEANKKIEDITRKLTSLEETNKQIKDIGSQLEGLESILKNPKQRGVLGEYFLENLLKNILPPGNFSLQYSFSDGVVVDGVVFVKDKIIPIDSKFSLENYNRILGEEDGLQKDLYIKDFRSDLKKRIDETSKYIKPEEGTMDFAFMFIPSEGIYYDLLVNKVGSSKANASDLIEYAFKDKKVIIVSPTSFYAYLQTVLQGLRALQIEEKAQEIRKQVEKLSKHLDAYEEYLEKLGNSLGTSVNHYNTAYKKFNMLEKDIVKITEEDKEQQTLELEKPIKKE